MMSGGIRYSSDSAGGASCGRPFACSVRHCRQYSRMSFEAGVAKADNSQPPRSRRHSLYLRACSCSPIFSWASCSSCSVIASRSPRRTSLSRQHLRVVDGPLAERGDRRTFVADFYKSVIHSADKRFLGTHRFRRRSGSPSWSGPGAFPLRASAIVRASEPERRQNSP